MLGALAPLPLPLRDLRFLLQVGQGVEPVGGETERLRYSEIALVLGEKRSSFGSEPAPRLIQ